MSKEKERALHALAVSERKIQRIDTKIDAARDQLALMLKLRREEVAKYNYLAANPVLENTEDEVNAWAASHSEDDVTTENDVNA